MMNAGRWKILLLVLFFTIYGVGVLEAQDCDDVMKLELSVSGVLVADEAVVDITDQNDPYLSVAVTLDGDPLNQVCDEVFDYLVFSWSDSSTFSCIAALPSTLPLVSEYSVDITCFEGEGMLLNGQVQSLSVSLVNLPEINIESGECEGSQIRLSVPEIAEAEGWSLSWTKAGFNQTVVDANFINVDLPETGEIDEWRVCVTYSGQLISCSETLVLNGDELRPTIDLTPVNAEDREVCENDELTLTASSPGQSFEWVNTSDPDEVLFNTATVNLPPGNYTVRTTGTGCPASEDFEVLGISGPSRPNLEASSDTEACPGEMAMVEVDTLAGLTYRWESTTGMELATGNTFSSDANTTFRVVAINSSGCASLPRTVSIAQSSAHNPQITASSQPPYCEGEMVTLTTQNLENAMVLWSTGETEDTIEVDAGGEYSVRFSGGTLCDNSDTITIAEFGEPTALPIQPDQSVFSGEFASIPILLGGVVRVTLDSVTTMNAAVTNVNVSPSGVLSFLPEGAAGARATGAIRFTLIPESAEGCTGPAQTLLVRVVPDVEEPFIPEIISPNGDGSNDEWAVVFPEDGADYDVVVYSRGGAVVFEGSGNQMPWDAGPCPNGVYYYRITQRGPEGGQWQGALTIIGREGR